MASLLNTWRWSAFFSRRVSRSSMGPKSTSRDMALSGFTAPRLSVSRPSVDFSSRVWRAPARRDIRTRLRSTKVMKIPIPIAPSSGE